MKKPFSCFLIVFWSISLLACSARMDGNSSRSSQSSKKDFENETSTTISEMEILPLMVENVVTIKKMELSSGRISITIYRPDGEVFLERIYTAPLETSDVIHLDMDRGVWKMKMEYVGATGNFFIKWNANN